MDGRWSGRVSGGEPVDRFRLCYWCFIVLGVSSLLPWNLFITAHEYFFYKLRNVTEGKNETEMGPLDEFQNSSEGTETYFQKTFENYFTLTGSVSNLLGNTASALLSDRVSNPIRMTMGHLLVLVALLPTVIFVPLDSDSWQAAFFILSLVYVNVANVGSSGFICGSSMGLAAKFPQDYVQAQIVGQAVAGVVTSLASIISQASTSKPKWNGLAYFVLAIIFTIFSMICYFVLLKSKFARFYLHKGNFDSADGSSDAKIEGSDSDRDPLLPESCEIVQDFENDQVSSYFGEGSVARVNIPVVLRKISFHAFVIIVTYTVTLSVFPALSSAVVSTSRNATWRSYFVPVCCFLLFNSGDFFGRFVTKWLRWPKAKSPLLFLFGFLRLLLIPLFLHCNLQPRQHGKEFLIEDYGFFILMITLSVSNGYLVTLGGMYGCKDVGREEMEIAGSFISLSCVLGVLIGSGFSFLVMYFVRNWNSSIGH